MYRYDKTDQQLVDERVAQFRDQTLRYLAGELSEDEYRPLRLQNGLYVQRFAPMLRVAIPYGTLSSDQLRMLGSIARRYDKDYAHFTTRQNIQYNWPALESVPDILADLATVEMHAIQTSGNCIRNVTSDPYAGVAHDEIEDPRPWCEIIRQWSSFHPEFAFLPRKFKIAVNAAGQDRAASRVHDIGLHVVRDSAGDTAFKVLVGGGLGRTPIIGVVIREELNKYDLLSYLEAILRVYNRLGRRDNKYKARIKILVKETGVEAFAQLVEDEFARMDRDELRLTDADITAIQAHFAPPDYAPGVDSAVLTTARESDAAFNTWSQHNLAGHKVPGHHVVVISLKPADEPPGDCSAQQMELIADLADRFGFGEIRVQHDQNLVLPDIRTEDLHALWQALDSAGLATPNIGTVLDMICCPGLDFCSLANAGSIGVAREIAEQIEDYDYLYDLGELRLNMSGCMNGCGHHSVGHIGILGVDKKGAEWYQISLGGSSRNDASLGDRLGAALPRDRVVGAITTLLSTYVSKREGEERFIDTYRRVGVDPFKSAVYSS